MAGKIVPLRANDIERTSLEVALLQGSASTHSSLRPSGVQKTSESIAVRQGS